jgi:hypothetical protein
MRILANGRVVGLDQCPGFGCQQEPLPLKLQILLCLVDGAERRRQIQANSTYTPTSRRDVDPLDRQHLTNEQQGLYLVTSSSGSGNDAEA